MLPDHGAAAAHHPVALLLLQQHPDHRGLGNRLVDPGPHPAVVLGGEELREEPGPVVGEDPSHAVSHAPRGPRRRVDGEVAALGVPADEQVAVDPCGDGAEVARSLGLGGHGAAVGEVEVLLPAHEGGVSAPEGDVGQVLGEPERHGRELLLGPGVGDIRVTHDPHVPEPGAGGHGGEEGQAGLLAPHAGVVGVEVLGAVQVRQAHPLPAAGRGEVRVACRQARVGHPGQDEAVNGAEAALVEALQPAPGVVEHVPHATHVLLLRSGPGPLAPRRPGPTAAGPAAHLAHSHSMVPGGLEVQSSTTRLTSGTELVMRVEMRARTS